MVQRQPHVEEMNPAIPDWVRAKIVNTLTWQLDLTVDESNPFAPVLKGTFYPGEVQWSDATKTANVVGRGKPIAIVYAPDPNVPIEAVAAPVIEFDYRNLRPLANPAVRYLRKGDSFKIMVTLPQPVAEKQGLKLPLVFHALSSGGTASVELETSPPALKDITATYSHTDEITIENRGHGCEDREPLFGLFPPASGFGPRLNLTTKNGEEVEMSAAGATYRFRIFDNAIELALARRADAINDLLLPMVGKYSASKDEKEIDDLTRRARMARTALRIAADTRLAADIRLALLNEYLSADGQGGLLLDKTLTWIPETDPDWSKANRFGTQWSAYEEAVDIDGLHTVEETNFWKSHPVLYPGGLDTSVGINTFQRATRAYQQKLRDAFARLLYKETAFSMYDLVVDQTGVETALVAFAGIDRFGNRMPLSQRLLTLVNWGAGKFHNALFDHLTEQGPIRKTVRKAGPPVWEELGAPPGADLPADMRPKPKRNIYHLDPSGSDASPTIPYKPQPANQPRANCQGPTYRKAAYRADPEGTLYPKAGAKVPGSDEPWFAQIDERGCLPAAIAEGLRNVMQEDLIDDYLSTHSISQTGPYRVALGGGTQFEDMSPILTKRGFANSPLPYKNIYREMQSAVDKNMVVVVGMRAPGTKGAGHAVRIRKYEIDGSGRVTGVRIFDPTPGDERLMPVSDFVTNVRGYYDAREDKTSAIALAIQRK
jgi:hypothetical protein